jgi:CheY-like chemotaxis protein
MPSDGFFSVESLRGMWVLLVDDERGSRELLTDILEHCGALVTSAKSAEAGLAIMRHVKPDVLVASLARSERDAEWLIKQIRARKPEDGGVIAAVLVTSGSPCSGFDGHLVHPFDPWELCRLITTITVTS